MIVAIACAKGSRGATTTALALASAWPQGPDRVVAELDPSGGDLAARFELAMTPGMLSLAAEGRPPSRSSLERHCQVLPGGLPVLVAPAQQSEAQTVIEDASRLYLAFHGAHDVVLFADCGRLLPTDIPLTVVRADVTVVLVHQAVRSAAATVGVIEHARDLVAALHRSAGDVVVALVGDRPYPAAEVEAAVGAEVVGVVDDDPLGAAWLMGRPARRRAAGRSRLIRSCGPIAERVARRLAAGHPGSSASAATRLAPSSSNGHRH